MPLLVPAALLVSLGRLLLEFVKVLAFALVRVEALLAAVLVLRVHL